MDRIHTAESAFRWLQLTRTPLETFVKRFLPEPFLAPRGVDANARAYVRVNHGRWVVDCPAGCTGAQMAFEDSRFFCVDCCHAGTSAEGKWVAVVWPLERAEIERVLLQRPDRKTRNWHPTESVQDLRDEFELQQTIAVVLARAQRRSLIELNDTTPEVPDGMDDA